MLSKPCTCSWKLHKGPGQWGFHVHARPSQRRQHQPRHSLAMAAAPQAAAATPTDVDVVVVGSGIIGLLITRQLLLSSELSVALFDVKQPCAGATGAGTVRAGHLTL